MTPRVASLLVLVLAVVLIGACGESGDDDKGTGYEDVLSSINGLEGAKRTDKLVRLAEREGGRVDLYTSLSSDVAAVVGEEFEDKYDIEVSVYRATGETVLQRVSEEAKADFQGADVIETNGPGLRILSDDGVLVNYASPARGALVKGTAHRGWTADRFNKFVVSWNSDRVRGAERPRSWEDLADPRWKGKLLMEAADFDWYKTLREHWLREGKSAREADRLFETMAGNASVAKGHSLMVKLLESGEFDVAASNYSYQVDEAIDEGAPVAWKPVVEPVISRAQGVGLVRRARHPASAILFHDWLLGEGQEVLAEHNVDPARKDLATVPQARELLIDVGRLVADQDEWTDRYDRLVSGRKTIEEPE